MRNLDAYSNLRKKDPNKDCDVGCRVILEYETTNEYNEPVKVFSVFPPQSLVAPILEAEFNWLLENRLKDNSFKKSVFVTTRKSIETIRANLLN